MKKILIALAVLAFGASALQQARGQDISIDYFYNNLSGGNWIDVEGYGYGWQPDVAVNDPNWRPYSDGYWAYTDYGWTWISYEDFGWATYHYGRWANLSDYGWVWFPGDDLDWGPAWVSWRKGGDYIGWAPLPPRGPGIVYEGEPIGPQVDIQFDIGPQYYNFIPVRYIGEPVLRNYIVPPAQNVTYISNTVNITNINVQNNVVYNRGPDINVITAASARPIQRLSIERQSVANPSAAANKVQGNKLLVAAPRRLANAPPNARPQTVKTRVAQPKFSRGWAGVPNEAELKQKIKTENPKNVPPPTGAAARPGGQSPAVGGSPAAPGAAQSPAGSPPGRPPRGGSPVAPPRAVTTPPVTPRGPAPRATPPPRGTPPGRPITSPPSRPSPAPGAPGRTFERGRPTPPPRFTPERAPGVAASPPGAERKPPAGGPPPPASRRTPPSGPEGQPPEREQRRIEGARTPRQARPGAPERPGGAERAQPGYGQPRTPPTRTGPAPGETRGGPERPQPGVRRPPTTPPAATGAAPGEARGGRERPQGAYGQPGGQPRGGAPAAERGQTQPERGRKKGEETPPPRGPQ